MRGAIFPQPDELTTAVGSVIGRSQANQEFRRMSYAEMPWNASGTF
jgi:hypothetical protein